MTEELTVTKTIGVRLDTLISQDQELEKLFNAFNIGINWSLQEIEKRHQKFLTEFKPLHEIVKGMCDGCNAEKDLRYTSHDKKFCASCAMKTYSEYTVRKEIYGVGERTVESDLKDVVEIHNKTHYTMLFSQAYAIWKSFNAWRNKRTYRAQLIQKELESLPPELYHAAIEIEQNARQIKSTNRNLTWLQANAQAFKAVYGIHPGIKQETISSVYDKLRDLRKLSRSLRLPQLEECRTIMMNAGFVRWNDGLLQMTLWEKKPQDINYFGKEYLNQFLSKMNGSNVYCNITKKHGNYFLMYPLEIKVKQPTDIKDCDTFVVLSSPSKIGVFGYDKDAMLNSVKWFGAGKLLFAKRHLKEKRAEITTRKSDTEQMRKIRRRRDKIKERGAIEQRFTSTFNHQLIHEIVEAIAEMSDNPKILIWDVGNGVTQNFGSALNYLKSMWPVVQQQDYLKHKAMQLSIPIIEIQYNKCNDLICSNCGSKQSNGKKSAKVVTQLIKSIKNFKCEKCSYEVNQLINQANTIANLK